MLSSDDFAIVCTAIFVSLLVIIFLLNCVLQIRRQWNGANDEAELKLLLNKLNKIQAEATKKDR